MTQTLKTHIAHFLNKRIVVIGDVILDEYLTGRATRMSREAPIPVLEFEARQHIPGGAANPAANMAALGANAVQIGVVGRDTAADHLREAMTTRGLHTDYLIVDDERPTTVKTRLMAHMGLRFPQQVARMDTISREPVRGRAAQQLFDAVRTEHAHADAILFSDYRNGLISAQLVTEVLRLTGKTAVLLTADAQGDFSKYRGLALVKCNAAEAADHLGQPLNTDADFAEAAQALRARLQLTHGMVITRGGDGATAATPEAVYHCQAPFVTDVFDTVGAGDTAIAVITLALVAGASVPEAVTLANYASGLVVRKVGNYAPSPDELSWALDQWHRP